MKDGELQRAASGVVQANAAVQSGQQKGDVDAARLQRPFGKNLNSSIALTRERSAISAGSDRIGTAAQI